MKHGEAVLSRPGSVSIYIQWWLPDTTPKASLALVHGIGEHSGRYSNLVGTLIEHGMAVYAVDNRGFGKSSGKRGHVMSWREYTDDTAAFLDRVREIKSEGPLFLMGHSMGGLIVLSFLLDHSPKDLNGVVVSGPALSQGAVSKVLLLAARIMSKVVPSFSLDTKLDASAVSRDPEVVAAYEADPLRTGMASARLGTEMAAAMEMVKTRAGEIRLPILIVHGGADRLVAPETSRELMPLLGSTDKTRIEYPSYYHEPHNDLDWQKPLSDIVQWMEKRI
jgi:alpha-beta hydrolase superfamily lysophospholipase